MNEATSVYNLVSRLCSSVIKESDESVTLKNAKCIAFQTLLKNHFSEIPDREALIQELLFSSFELSLAGRNDKSKQVNDFIEKVKEGPSGTDAICWLLVFLKNIDPDPEANRQKEQTFFRIPSNFRLVNKKNVYIPSKSETLINLPSAAPDDDCSFFSGILNSYTGHKKNDARKLPNVALKFIEMPEPQETCTRKIKNVFSWENLASGDEVSSKSFSSESSIPIQPRLTASKSKDAVEIRSIPFHKLLNDIKLLSIGIESESFKRARDDPLTFKMPLNFSCEDVSDIGPFVEEFLETGTCFKRLKTFTSKNPFNQCYIFEGFIFRAFCDCIIKFMNYYKDVVYSQDVPTLLQFASNTRSIRRILIHLTRFLKIHPSSTSRSVLPSGSDFLGLLYNEYSTSFNNDVKCFFVECLKSCCQIYFNNFSKWLFHGFVDDPHRELFVYFIDHYRPNTKYFFDKAYTIRKQSVPAFLQGCAENILLCGKYTMLLKSYNHIHPLFMHLKPPLKVCLTGEELDELRAQCQEFVKLARAACGPAISIRKIMQDRENAKKEKYKKSESASTTNMLRWRREQEVLRIENAEKREIKMQGLRDELQRIEERKLVKRMEAIQAERDYLDEVEELQSKEMENENDELRKRIEVYKQLNEQLDADSEQCQQIVDGLKITLESKNNTVNTATSKDDVLNANEPSPSSDNGVDEMNNVISKTTNLSEAERNKLKILSHEYNVITPETTREANDNPSTRSTDQTMTEARRNKLKILGTDIATVETENAPKISVQTCENMTDLQRNRLKVLSHEYNLEREAPKAAKASKAPPKSLNLLQVETVAQHLESPMSVTSDHFSNDSDNHRVETESKSIDGDAETVKSQVIDDDAELDMLRAFEEAIEKNLSTFMGINLNECIEMSSLSKYEHIRHTDSMALSRFLQMSLMTPVNAYMEIMNNETLKMFVQDLEILSHFKSLRNYFLMMNGEFGSSICHLLFSKLESGVKPSELLNYQSLHMILDHALCQTRHDPNIEKLSFIVQNIPEKFDMHSPSVLNMLTMSYKLDWPLNLILNPETMDQYKAIFNYLLKLKRISWILEECFQLLKESHKKHGRDMTRSQQFRNVQQARHKMNHFVHCLENHVTRNVLQISWGAFVEDLKTAQSIHCIYRKHTNYLKRVLFLCLLNKKSFEFQKTIDDLFKVILKFQKHLKANDWQRSGNDFIHPKYQKIASYSDDFERLIKYVLYLGNKIIQHGYQKEIHDLLYLIDINGYYSQA